MEIWQHEGTRSVPLQWKDLSFIFISHLKFNQLYRRIKEDSLLKIKGKKLYSAAKFFSVLNPKEQKVYPMAIELYGQKVFLAGARSERGELMIVATNQAPQQAIYAY